jgi:two-component sensor histidine kinase
MTLQTYAPKAATPPIALHLVEEFSHRVINEYTEAILSLSAAAHRSANPSVRETLEAAARRLVAYAAAHRALLPPAAAGRLNLADYVGDLCATLTRAAPAEIRVRVTLETDDVWLDADRCWRIGLILAELMRNAMRHGLRGGPGEVAIRVVDQPDHVVCLVSDDGCAPENPTPGRGQRLMRSLASELGGDIDWRFTPLGSLARLQAPKIECA